MEQQSEPAKTEENWALKGPLLAASIFLAILGAALTYGLVTEYFGYHGNKVGIFGIAGGFVGYMLTDPLWRLYRKKYPKASD